MVSALLLANPGSDAKIEAGLLKKLAADEDTQVPFFVVFAERPDFKALAKIKNKKDRGKEVAKLLKQVADKSQGATRGWLKGRSVEFTAFWIENKIYVKKGTLELARDLAQRSDVAAIVPEQIYNVPAPAITTQAVDWNLSKIRADQAWTITQGAGIVVANIDTGVQFNHPALVRQYRGNSGTTFSHAGNWSDPTGGSPSTPVDGNGHGTHTMGTMVGNDGAANAVGVAPGAKWIACRGCSGSSCSGSALAACAQWVMDPQGNGSYNGQPDVVNNSWGGGGGSTWYQSYLKNWRAAGIFPAFSAGNSGPGCSTAGSPGDNAEAYASGATDANDVIASFSSRGPSLLGGVKPNIAAPGVSVRSSVPTNGYAYYSGTSMASPHTAGVVALVWAAAPGYAGNVAATEALLNSTATKLTTSETCGNTAGQIPNNTFGYGRIDALAAVQAAKSSQPNQSPLVDITSPTVAAQFNCGTSVSFTGTATDPEQGSLSSSIQWTEGSTSAGTGSTITRTWACTSNPSEQRTLNATVKDSGGATATDAVTVVIVNPNVPSAPTSLKASVSSRQVMLSWMWSGVTPLTGFRVERKLKNATTWTVVTTTASSARSYTDPVTAGSWQYRVFAVNGSAVSASSNVVSARVR